MPVVGAPVMVIDLFNGAAAREPRSPGNSSAKAQCRCASMGPRLEGRGSRYHSNVLVVGAVLQWGRGFASRGVISVVGYFGASYQDLQWGRGSRAAES